MNRRIESRTRVLLALAGSLVAVACSSSSSGEPAGAGGAPAVETGTTAAVPGASDEHCKGMTPVVVDQAACMGSGMGGMTGADGMAGMAGMGAGGAGEGAAGAGGDCQSTDPGFGAIAYGSEADDDDCKYHVAWQSTAIAENADATIVAKVTRLADGSPATGAATRTEVFLPCDPTHPPPNADFSATTTETAPGVYQIGPLQFDRAGDWAVRFHVYETCNDAPTSPHGHVAFYVRVP